MERSGKVVALQTNSVGGRNRRQGTGKIRWSSSRTEMKVRAGEVNGTVGMVAPTGDFVTVRAAPCCLAIEDGCSTQQQQGA